MHDALTSTLHVYYLIVFGRQKNKKGLEWDNEEETVIKMRFLVFEKRKITMDNTV